MQVGQSAVKKNIHNITYILNMTYIMSHSFIVSSTLFFTYFIRSAPTTIFLHQLRFFCTNYDLSTKKGRNRPFHEFRNKSATNLFPSCFNCKSPSYLSMLCFTFKSPIPLPFPLSDTGIRFFHFTFPQLFSI